MDATSIQKAVQRLAESSLDGEEADASTLLDDMYRYMDPAALELSVKELAARYVSGEATAAETRALLQGVWKHTDRALVPLKAGRESGLANVTAALAEVAACGPPPAPPALGPPRP